MVESVGVNTYIISTIVDEKRDVARRRGGVNTYIISTIVDWMQGISKAVTV